MTLESPYQRLDKVAQTAHKIGTLLDAVHNALLPLSQIKLPQNGTDTQDGLGFQESLRVLQTPEGVVDAVVQVCEVVGGLRNNVCRLENEIEEMKRTNAEVLGMKGKDQWKEKGFKGPLVEYESTIFQTEQALPGTSSPENSEISSMVDAAMVAEMTVLPREFTVPRHSQNLEGLHRPQSAPAPSSNEPQDKNRRHTVAFLPSRVVPNDRKSKIPIAKSVQEKRQLYERLSFPSKTPCCPEEEWDSDHVLSKFRRGGKGKGKERAINLNQNLSPAAVHDEIFSPVKPERESTDSTTLAKHLLEAKHNMRRNSTSLSPERRRRPASQIESPPEPEPSTSRLDEQAINSQSTPRQSHPPRKHGRRVKIAVPPMEAPSLVADKHFVVPTKSALSKMKQGAAKLAVAATGKVTVKVETAKVFVRGQRGGDLVLVCVEPVEESVAPVSESRSMENRACRFGKGKLGTGSESLKRTERRPNHRVLREGTLKLQPQAKKQENVSIFKASNSLSPAENATKTAATTKGVKKGKGTNSKTQEAAARRQRDAMEKTRMRAVENAAYREGRKSTETK